MTQIKYNVKKLDDSQQNLKESYSTMRSKISESTRTAEITDTRVSNESIEALHLLKQISIFFSDSFLVEINKFSSLNQKFKETDRVNQKVRSNLEIMFK